MPETIQCDELTIGNFKVRVILSGMSVRVRVGGYFRKVGGRLLMTSLGLKCVQSIYPLTRLRTDGDFRHKGWDTEIAKDTKIVETY
jgi:hypothetical protein